MARRSDWTPLRFVMVPAPSPGSLEVHSSSRPTVIYLDQNMWIDLARATKAPDDHPRERELLEILCAKVRTGGVRLPLTASNLYETHKVKKAELRAAIAYTQAMLSKAEVFRGRRRRLEVEVARVLCELYGLPWKEPHPEWMFSRLFFESQAELGDPRLGLKMSDRVLESFRSDPQAALIDYLIESDDGVRREAVARFEQGCDGLKAEIEERRLRHRNESLSMRRRIYSMLLAHGDQEILIAVADQLALPWRCFEDNKGATIRYVINETPAFLIEREIGLKLENQARPIHVNDMRDMRNFTTVLPYADVVVAEKQFTNLARQAALETRFGVRLETDLEVLRDL